MSRQGFSRNFFFVSFAQTKASMKTFRPLVIAALAFIASCTRPDIIPTLGKMRDDCNRRYGALRDSRGTVPSESGPDTTLYFTTVSFPEDYDWQRDSAWGAVSFRITLYKDFEPVLSILSDTCRFIRPDPDLHHIIDGHLYTECTLGGSTVIACDGLEVLRLPGKELLRGLYPDDGGLYSLSQPRDGGGFSLRRDGEVIFMSGSGQLFGSMTDPSYGPGGALYRDRGSIRFCFREGNGSGMQYYSYTPDGDAVALNAPTGTVNDMKSVSGMAVFATERAGSSSIEDSRVLPTGTAKAVISGWIDGKFTGTVREDGSGAREISPVKAAVHSPETAVSDEGGMITLWKGGDAVFVSDGACFFFPGCLSVSGDSYALGLTGRGSGPRPYMVRNGRTVPVDVYGYIGDVELQVNLPSSGRGNLPQILLYSP